MSTLYEVNYDLRYTSIERCEDHVAPSSNRSAEFVIEPCQDDDDDKKMAFRCDNMHESKSFFLLFLKMVVPPL